MLRSIISETLNYRFWKQWITILWLSLCGAHDFISSNIYLKYKKDKGTKSKGKFGNIFCLKLYFIQ